MIRFTAIARAAVLLTVASSFIAVAPAAFAAEDGSVPQGVVNIAGTDFTSAKDIAHVQNRVRHTAFAICTRDWDGHGPLTSDERQCYDTALHDGLAQIESKHMEALRETSTNLASAQPEERLAH